MKYDLKARKYYNKSAQWHVLYDRSLILLMLLSPETFPTNKLFCFFHSKVVSRLLFQSLRSKCGILSCFEKAFIIYACLLSRYASLYACFVQFCNLFAFEVSFINFCCNCSAMLFQSKTLIILYLHF